jgi:hypothetical protein
VVTPALQGDGRSPAVSAIGARHISKSSSNAREGQSNCQASHETKKDAQFQDSHYLASLLEVRAARRDSLIQFL